ncbi:hypothetical protein [Marinilabilia rubra]|nr:hypothetical protein [Marinilabilia rubra]
MQRARPAKELEDVDPLSGILGGDSASNPRDFRPGGIRIRRFQRQGGSSV